MPRSFKLTEISGLPRILPEWLEGTLRERDQLLNRAPPEDLLEIYTAREAAIFVDRMGAIKAAQAGLFKSRLGMILSMCMPVLIVIAAFLLFFISWQYAALSEIAGAVSSRAGGYSIVEDVRGAALRDPSLLELLMRQGIVWFEVRDT